MPDDEQKTDPEKAAEGSSQEGAQPSVAPGAGDEGEAGESAADRYRPEAIAARVGSIGQESDLDRLANEEEKKLLERKRTQKKKGLEASASKRLAKIGEGTVRRPSALGDSVAPEADPLLGAVSRASSWIKEHRQSFGGFLAVAALGVAGLVGWQYAQGKRNAEASTLLAQALADEHGHIVVKDTDDDDDAKPKQMYPTFKSVAERREAALGKYRQVESKYSGTGAAMLARLAEASLLLDSGDAKGASVAYGDVKSSPLGQADGEVRGRALEGLGFADELLAQTDAASKDKHLDDAMGEFSALEKVDVKGFRELGKYHQARVAQAKGDKAKAIELLKDVHKEVSEPGESQPFSYLEFVVEDRLRELDPTALPPKASKGGMPGATPSMDDPRMKQLIEQLRKQGTLPPGLGGGAPPAGGSSPGSPK